MDWFTSDPHFWHKNVIAYCNRPFQDVDSMNSALSHQWNSVVKESDTVYILGDWCFFGPTNAQKVADHMNSLNGKKKMIFGNHDNKKLYYKLINDGLVSNLEILGEKAEIKSFDSTGAKFDITLCHYAHRVWNKSHYSALHLYGHTHSTLPNLGRSMDVGVDMKYKLYGEWSPFSIDQVIEQLGHVKPHDAV